MTGSTALKNISSSRITSIDLVRGIIMVIMALDHTRDLLHLGATTNNPLDLTTTTPVLFFTRWITHFCAPGFVFLAGTSAFLYGMKKDKVQLRKFLISRGAWLILIDIILMTLLLSFNPHYNMIILSVLWAIGMSMILLGFLCGLSWKIIATIGLAIIFLHDLLNPVVNNPITTWGAIKGFLYTVPTVLPLSKTHVLLVAYSFLPWTGIMLIGFVTGQLFTPSYSKKQRIKTLYSAGVATIIIFIILRFINIYGDLIPWSSQKTFLLDVLSFINTNKYPPSLLFVCMTLGPILLLLAAVENAHGWLSKIFIVYGNVPFFYYVIHFFTIRIISVIIFYMMGFKSSEIASGAFYFHPDKYGISLTGVYMVWIAVVIFMYPLCAAYKNYKQTHKEKWWLSYV